MKFLPKMFKEEKGQVMVIVALAMVVLLGFTALAVDGGALYLERRNMVTAADAAALAGAKELYLSDSNVAKAVAEAKKYAETNGAAITDEIEVVNVDYNGATVKGVSVNVGRNKGYTFGRVLGLDNTNVMAKATAVWLYPTHYAGDLFPLFYELPSGNELPDDQQVLLDEKLTSGNWGLLDVGSGMNDINDVFAGVPYSAGELVAFYTSGGDYVLAYTQPGNAESRINAIEERMDKAKNPDSGVTMEGIIPIAREFEENGKAVIKIVGFASFLIEDVITAETKETDNLWWGRGSTHALIANPPKLYGGFEKKQDLSDEFPKGALIGHFLEKNFIPASEVIAGTQDSDYDYGTLTVKLIK